MFLFSFFIFYLHISSSFPVQKAKLGLLTYFHGAKNENYRILLSNLKHHQDRLDYFLNSNEIQKSLSLDYFLDDKAFKYEIYNVSKFIVEKVVYLLDVMPGPLELIELYKDHEMFPDSFEDSNPIFHLLFQLYIHHLKENQNLWPIFLNVGEEIVNTVDDASARAFDRFQLLNGHESHESTLSFMEQLKSKTSNIISKFEFHVLFRSILLELLLNLWDSIFSFK